jgi:hypothetical protein
MTQMEGVIREEEEEKAHRLIIVKDYAQNNKS